MPPSFFNFATKSKGQLVCVDLGSRLSKAVHLRRSNGALTLSRFALLDAPIYEKSLSIDLLSEHLKQISRALEVKSREVALAIGVNDSLVRAVEMPMMPLDDMRQILKNNSKVYLQQDLPGHIFDCYIVPPKTAAALAPDKGKDLRTAKFKTLVAGAKKQFIADLQAAVKAAGLTVESIVPSLIAPANAFEAGMPDVFAKGIVALVDIGFHNSSISILQEGELVLTRVVALGGDKLTAGLAEAMNISYAEAEGIKVGMAGEVRSQLEALVVPLGRELRASVDFFEHQQDKTVTEIYVSGGSARSELLVQMLQNELVVPCKTWNPAARMQLALPPQQADELERVAPQLTVAIGAALSAL